MKASYFRKRKSFDIKKYPGAASTYSDYRKISGIIYNYRTLYMQTCTLVHINIKLVHFCLFFQLSKSAYKVDISKCDTYKTLLGKASAAVLLSVARERNFWTQETLKIAFGQK
jgi:hypothetical protein